MSLINHDQRDHLKLLRENGTDGIYRKSFK